MATATENFYDPPITTHEKALAEAPCHMHCSVCEGEDHHWMSGCCEDTGLPWMVCKHCDAKRPYGSRPEDDDY